MSTRQIKYIQLESSAFLTDLDFVAMTLEERGLYCTLILYLYSNNGKCKFDIPVLSRLANCENIETFEKIWQNISKKFQVRNGSIKHKRVTKELTRAKKYRQHQRKAGLASARIRQQRLNLGSNDVATQVQPTKTKGNVNEKESKDTSYSNSKEQFLSSLTSARTKVQALNFDSALTNIIKPRTQSDRTCFRNITKWLIAGCATGQFNNEIFARVLDYAREARAGRNPPAMFMSLLKKELNYRPKQRE